MSDPMPTQILSIILFFSKLFHCGTLYLTLLHHLHVYHHLKIIYLYVLTLTKYYLVSFLVHVLL